MSRSGKRSRTSLSQSVEDYSIYLKDPNNLQQFKEFQTFEILPGRFVKFDDFISHNLGSYFENVGLLELFSSENRRPCYPLLVQLFYVNITRTKPIKGPEKINTLVKGIEIDLNINTIGRILNIPYKGISLEKVRMNDQNILTNHIFLPGQGPPLNQSNKLRPIPRFIARILAYNLFPKTGSFNFISLDLAKALYAIMANIQVNWAEVYYQNLLVLPRGFLPYGAFLTYIFEKFNVDVESETSIVRSVEFFDSNALTRMKLTNFELPEQQPHEPQSPQQEQYQPQPSHTQDIPQSSYHAGPSSSHIPPPMQPESSYFSDAQYNTLSARILALETQQTFMLHNQEELTRKLDNLDMKFDTFSMNLNRYFQGNQPPPGSSS